jgi:hypothetical protein
VFWGISRLCQNNRGARRANRASLAEQNLPCHPPFSPLPPHMFRSSDNDPLTAAIAPPKHESTSARAARLRAEAEARRVSDEIDEQLKQDRAARRRQRPCVKVLLLGQSESGTFRASSSFIHRHMLSCLGKSTTLKSECPFIFPPPLTRFSIWTCWR